MLISLLCGAVLSACGGATDPAAAPVTELVTAALADDVRAPAAAADAVLADATPAQEVLLAALAQSGSAPALGRVITDVRFESLAATPQSVVPVTFGQVFADGDVGAGDALAGQLADGSLLPLQMDVKARHADHFVRHALLTAVLPALAPGQILSLRLVKAGAAPAPQAMPAPAALLAAGLRAGVVLTVDGARYTATVEDLLKSGAAASWLNGALVNEWMVAAPLRNAAGQPHPHLSARFDVRAYAGLKQAKIDVILENDWAYEAGPRNFVYDVQISVGGQPVYSKPALTHYHHARWKKTFWWGAAPQVLVKHNSAYLMASRALPNYDPQAVPSAATLGALRLAFNGALTEPMQRGLATAYMPQTGGRPDIGLLPGWAVSYLLSMDKDAKAAMLGAADLAGSWSAHFRDRDTGRVVSLLDHPYMTLLGRAGDTINPATRKSEAFPACGGDCASPLSADSSHEPNFAYLPYLVTGDHFYLEELQFWAMFNLLQANPGYRSNLKGLLGWDQIRGQAWSLRTLAEAAAITPEADPLKLQFETFLSNNLAWYNAAYSANGKPDNALGAITDVHALVYDGGRGLAPWQDDFFTMAVGHVAELGYAAARPLLRWKSTFPVGRMLGAGYCWIDASVYKLIVRDSASGPNYTSFGAAYRASEPPAVTSAPCASAQMAAALGLKTGEMVGYADVIDGYPAYLQGALAYSVGSGNPDAARAWALFLARPVKPDYRRGAQFAILPR